MGRSPGVKCGQAGENKHVTIPVQHLHIVCMIYVWVKDSALPMSDMHGHLGLNMSTEL